jgi:hypothetical protein
MNIFFLHISPKRAARWHCDKHVVKMILESAQLLYTAHWVLGIQPDLSTAPVLATKSDQHGYMPIRNKNHPCAIWVRQSIYNYMWVCRLGLYLCMEHMHRFSPTKPHSSLAHLRWLLKNPPSSIPHSPWTRPAMAMPDDCKVGLDVIRSYRNYYIKNKGAQRGMLQYTGRCRPHWQECV